MREVSELQNNPPEGIRLQASDEDMLDVTGIIEGPGESTRWSAAIRRVCPTLYWVAADKLPNGGTEGTPYAGGFFKVKFKFTEEFPAAPPKCERHGARSPCHRG